MFEYQNHNVTKKRKNQSKNHQTEMKGKGGREKEIIKKE
jgi:hypothetical protein